jgi:hypothetical protein
VNDLNILFSVRNPVARSASAFDLSRGEPSNIPTCVFWTLDVYIAIWQYS